MGFNSAFKGLILLVMNFVPELHSHVFCSAVLLVLEGNILPYYGSVAYPGIFFGGGSTNPVDRGQRERGSRGVAP